MGTLKPVYDHPPGKVNGGLWTRLARLDLVENLFFGAALVFSFVFALIVLAQTTLAPVSILYVLGFWAVLSYLALPRLHRVLTTLYVPDYFIGRARTSDGLLGDPVNLAFLGEAEQLHAAMRRAGWVQADPVDLTSAVRMITAAVGRRSYPNAPVSPLFLFGNQQAFAYQQEVEGNPSQRHHVRFWPCPPGWLLPGGRRVGWVAAGTYDRKVGLSLFTFQVTHKIDRNIDIERDYIVETLRYGVPETRVEVIEDFSTGYHSRNGGGDAVVTDGDLPVVDLTGVDASGEPAPPPVKTDLAHEVGRRPLSVLIAFVMTLISMGSTLSYALWVTMREIAADPDITTSARVAVVAWVMLVAAALIFLAWRTFEGGELARLLMLLLTSFTLAGELLGAMAGQRPAALAMAATAIDLLTIYALTSLSARSWTRARRDARRERRRLRKAARRGITAG